MNAALVVILMLGRKAYKGTLKTNIMHNTSQFLQTLQSPSFPYRHTLSPVHITKVT